MAGLPEGFTIDQPATAPATVAKPVASGLPAGFTLDQPEAPSPSAPAESPGMLDRVGSAAKAALPYVPFVGPAASVAVNNAPLIGEAVRNAPHSAVEFAKNTVQPFLHPIDTADSLKNLGLGVLQKAGIASGDDSVKYADAVGKFYADRYGGIENAKRAFATDPVGVLGDLSLVLTGGGSAAGRLPGVAGKLGEVAGTVGRTIDPLSAAVTAASPVAKAASEVAGLTTGVGGQSLRTAAKAGYEGGEAGRAFRENMSGAAPFGDAVDDARSAVSRMRQERGDVYRRQMADIGLDQQVLNFDKIDDAMRQAGKVQTYKGQDISPTTQSVRHQIADVIDNWRALDPAEFHTAEGLDALKRKIGDIRDSTVPHTPERVVADRAYHGVRDTIVKQAPDYAGAMKGYEQASNLIKEMEKTLSINGKASVDTTLRKLQSVLRDNVNTSYGRRTELAKYLVNAGAPNLMEKLAGQALSAWAPRGLARVIAPAAIGAGAFNPAALSAAIPALAMSSPRLAGEIAHGAGRAARAATPLRSIPRVARAIEQFKNPYGEPHER